MHKYGRFQFSVRSLIILVTIVIIVVAIGASIHRRAQRQRRAVTALENAGADIAYEFEVDEFGWIDTPRPPTLSQWLGSLVGYNVVYDVVYVEWKDVSDDDIVHFSHLNDLSTVRAISISGSRLSDKGLRALRDVPQIVELDLNRWDDAQPTSVTDVGIAQISELPNLAYLDLTSTRVTDAGLAHVGSMVALEELTLSATTVSDEGLFHLRKLVHLRKLDLGLTGITGSGIVHLVDLPHLQELLLSETQLTDTGLHFVSQLSNLTTLNVTSTQITNAGAAQLTCLVCLRKLWISRPPIESATIETFKTALPRCAIVEADLGSDPE